LLIERYDTFTLLPLLGTFMNRCIPSLLAILFASITVGAHADQASKTIVTINDQTITERELADELGRPDLKATLESIKDDPATIQKLKAAVVQSIIDRELLLSVAKHSSTIKEDDIKKELDAVITQQGGRAQIEPVLSSYGATWELFMKGMTERITIEKYITAELSQGVLLDDSALKKEFDAHPERYAAPEMVSARHILIRLNSGASEAESASAQKKASEIFTRATAKGSDFSKLASEVSEDETTKAQGGNLGHFRKGMMVPEFEEASFSLPVGEVSKPIKTAYGYHIIKVEEHTKPHTPPFESVKENVRYAVMAQAHEKLVTDKLKELRKDASISYLDAAYKPLSAEANK
jgi:parvulin-like peptidyl-prolyl isomerase